MQHKNLTPHNPEKAQQEKLKARIAGARRELEIIQQEILSFENILRSHLTNEIIEEQELSVLYKNQKQEKKDKRQEQVKKGKNYNSGSIVRSISENSAGNKAKIHSDSKEKKRLYREAMLHSHPDIFSLTQNKIDVATVVTTRLIEIYKFGNLKELREYHLHILSGNAILGDNSSLQKTLQDKDRFLQEELKGILDSIEHEKNRATYIVLKEYEDPLNYVQELKAYYEDRLGKLRKRTRKGLRDK